MGVILALDPGQRRTGIAISDRSQTLARPHSTHDRRRDPSLLRVLAELVQSEDVETVVVGLPLTQMGERGAAAQHAEALAEKLQEHLPVPVVLVDERYSTAEAKRVADARRPRGHLDAVAATLLLQGFLDQRPADQ